MLQQCYLCTLTNGSAPRLAIPSSFLNIFSEYSIPLSSSISLKLPIVCREVQLIVQKQIITTHFISTINIRICVMVMIFVPLHTKLCTQSNYLFCYSSGLINFTIQFIIVCLVSLTQQVSGIPIVLHEKGHTFYI